MKLDLLQKFTVTGFGNVTSLPIASVDQQPEQLGRLAVRRLCTPESGRTLPCPEVLDVSLVNTGYIPFAGDSVPGNNA